MPSNATTPAPQSQSGLLELPCELRNQIFHDVFTEVIVELDGISHSVPFKWRVDSKTPGLLLACHQIYYEAIGVYYSLSVFQTDDDYSARVFLKKLPEKRLASITNIRVNTAAVSRSRYRNYSSTPALSNMAHTTSLDMAHMRRSLGESGTYAKMQPGALKVSVEVEQTDDRDGSSATCLWIHECIIPMHSAVRLKSLRL